MYRTYFRRTPGRGSLLGARLEDLDPILNAVAVETGNSDLEISRRVVEQVVRYINTRCVSNKISSITHGTPTGSSGIAHCVSVQSPETYPSSLENPRLTAK